MFSAFFIDRPKFALVIAIVLTLAGAISIYQLPVAEYPAISPPSIVVSGVYPGASAEVVEETVAAPIEEQVNGVEQMIYMSSKSANDGSYNLTVTFAVGSDPDMALNNLERFFLASRSPLALAALFDRDATAIPILLKIFFTFGPPGLNV